MSTSLGFDEDRNKRPVPSRHADDAELARAARRARRGMAGSCSSSLTRPASRCARTCERMADLYRPARRGRAPGSACSTTTGPPGLRRCACSTSPGSCRPRAIGTTRRSSPRTLDIQVNWDGGMSWFTLAERLAHDGAGARPEEKRAAARPGVARAWPGRSGTRVPRTMIPHKHPGPDPAGRGDPARERALGGRDAGRPRRRPRRPSVRRAGRLAARERPATRASSASASPTATRPGWPRR